VNNERFQTFVEDLAEIAAKNKPESLDLFMDMIFDEEKKLSVNQVRNLVIQSLGENIQIKRIEIITKDPQTSIGVYSHMGGKIVTVVEIAGANDKQDLAKEVAMHVAAENPEYISADDVPNSVKEREEEIAKSQIKGKPEHVVNKIIAGKLQAFCNDFCLNCQKFIKDSSVTVEQYLAQQSKDLHIRRFWRWKIGQ
jgi:elongation factor Ts